MSRASISLLTQFGGTSDPLPTMAARGMAPHSTPCVRAALGFESATARDAEPGEPSNFVTTSLSVVIPMYNEEESIEAAVAAARATLEPLGADYEIVIVDDGSTDRSAARAEALAVGDPRLRVLRHERNRTLGAALRTGFAAARRELVLYTDADLPVDLRVLPRALDELERSGADLLAAYRLNPAAAGRRRALYTRAYNRLIRALFGLPVRDVNFAFKLFRRGLLDSVTLRSEGSLIDAELLLKARNAGARFVELGVEYQPRRSGRSTLASPRVILKLLWELVALRRELRPSRRPVPKRGG
jgi:glycosyltransferase involved in cell wall biosynthesis